MTRPRTLMGVAALLLTLMGAAPALAQVEWCVIVLARRPADNALLTQVMYDQPTEKMAVDRALVPLVNAGYQYVAHGRAINGAVALALYRDMSGQLRYGFANDSNAVGAVMGVLDTIGTPGVNVSATSPPWINFVRCTNSPPVAAPQFQQMTWSTNLTSRYAGYQATDLRMDAHSGSLFMTRAPTAPPVVPGPPTPPPIAGPPSWGDPLVGCWQQFDVTGQPVDGVNVIYIGPRGSSPTGGYVDPRGWVGVYAALSPTLAARSISVGDAALSISAKNPEGTAFTASFNGRGASAYSPRLIADVTVQPTAIATVGADQNRTFVWRRVNCPAR